MQAHEIDYSRKWYAMTAVAMGIFQSPNNSVIMGAAPPNQLGVVSGLLAVTRTLGQIAGIAILSAVWANYVYSYAGQVLSGGATTASVQAQVWGLQGTYRMIAGLIVFALLLGMWAYTQERKVQAQSATHA